MRAIALCKDITVSSSLAQLQIPKVLASNNAFMICCYLKRISVYERLLMRGILNRRNVNPATSATVIFLARHLLTQHRSLECPNKYNLAIFNAHIKSTENINSNDVPTDFYQKTQPQYTKVLKI